MEHDCPCDDLVDWKAMVDCFRSEQERWHDDLHRTIELLEGRLKLLEDAYDTEGD